MRTVSGPNGEPLTAPQVTNTCGTNLIRTISLTAATPLASVSPTSMIIKSGRQCEAAATALLTLLSTTQTVWPRPSSVSASKAPIHCVVFHDQSAQRPHRITPTYATLVRSDGDALERPRYNRISSRPRAD